MTKILSCLAGLVLALVGVARAQNWTNIRNVEALAGEFNDYGKQIHFVLLRIDPMKNSIQIVDTYRLLHKANAYSAFSIAEVKKATNAIAVVNAGSTKSFAIPDPVGLLKIRGTTVSRENPAVTNGGVLCLRNTGVTIFPIPLPDNAGCVYAVQRGPVLGPSLHYPASYAQDKYTRSAVAVDDKGRLIILVTTDSISLTSMAYFLYKSKLNLSIQSVLNLDGGPSSGLMLSNQQPGLTTAVGNVDALVASAIAIF